MRLDIIMFELGILLSILNQKKVTVSLKFFAGISLTEYLASLILGNKIQTR